jgi:hypothetical protein
MSRFSGQLDEKDSALRKNKKKTEDHSSMPPMPYAPEQIVMGEGNADAFTNVDTPSIDVTSFIDDLADDTNNVEGGYNDGYVE